MPAKLPAPGLEPGPPRRVTGGRWNEPALIAALFALLSVSMPLLGVVAVGFAVAALWTPHRRRLLATSLAVAALVFCPVWFVHQVHDGAQLLGPGGSELSTLEVGECYDLITDQDGRNTSRVRPVSCAGRYEGRVYATFQLTGSSHSSGSAALHRQADARCAAWRAENGRQPGTMRSGVPSDRRWSTDGKRRATCAYEWVFQS